MNGQHLRSLPVEELVPEIGEALVNAGICEEATGSFVRKVTTLLQGSLELVSDAIPQTREILAFQVKACATDVLSSQFKQHSMQHT